MKKLYPIILVLFVTLNLQAQSPQKMSYQAVVRNSSNALVISGPVGMRISILQGTANGTAVYVETHALTTNANGLVSLEIGGGTPFTGTLSTINWSSGPYFIKTETDPQGGSSYTISGTTQFLSVPYALHAKTAESISGTITETDPVFGAAPASSISGSDISIWNSSFAWGNHALAGYLMSEVDGVIGNEINNVSNTTLIRSGSGTAPSPFTVGLNLSNINTWTAPQTFSSATSFQGDVDFTGNILKNGTTFTIDWINISGKPVFMPVATSGDFNDLSNKPVTDGSETKLTAGNNVSVTGTGTNGSPYVINSIPTHYAGELFGGGVVFYVDQTGNHGLICSMTNLSAGSAWSNVYSLIGPTAQSEWNSEGNTSAIMSQAGYTGGASSLCDAYINPDYGTGTFSDWYLPAFDILNLIYNTRGLINKTLDSDGNAGTTGITRNIYWSSTEGGPTHAWVLDFTVADPIFFWKNSLGYVRAIRAF
jgi:hypothetical protein